MDPIRFAARPPPRVDMPRYFEFSVSLRHVLPRPWRRFRLRASATYEDLHDAIADAAGWSGTHLYAFVLDRFGGEVVVAPPDPDGRPLELFDAVSVSAERMRLARHFGADFGLVTTCTYFYDFGDGWEADVLLHDLVELPGRARRMLVGAEHPWPPEDCGGPPGYDAIREALETGRDPDGLLGWARERGWTPALDLDALRLGFDE
jgi:hypothetical protein